jgi:ABC-type nitrate/sulfonate/bicarbonate transport system permease component
MATIAPSTSRASASTSNAVDTTRYVARTIGRTLLTIVISAVILTVIWYVALKGLNANAFIAKTPLDVVKYLFVKNPLMTTSPSDIRHTLWQLLLITLYHAVIGFVGGIVGSVIVAVLFTLIRPLEFMFMPLAMLLRTVPLLAMAPVIYLVLGNGALTAGFIGGVVVFFPLLVNLTLGFRSVSAQSVDLIRVYGGNRWTIMTKVAFPTALPHFFASMRIAVPGALTGAMLYEWLFTFQGLGGVINQAKTNSNYGQIWAIVVVITVVAIVFYTITTFVETAVLAKWGPNAGKSISK